MVEGFPHMPHPHSLHSLLSLQVKLHLQKSQLLSFFSFINEGKVWKNLQTVQTHCKYPMHDPDHTIRPEAEFLSSTNVPWSSDCFPLCLRYTVIKGCCQWKDQDRPSLAEVSRKLSSGEKSASDKVLKALGTVNIEQYLQEAGYGETNSYTVFWSAPVSAGLIALFSRMVPQ